jgi:ribose transport system substrate-binding protein
MKKSTLTIFTVMTICVLLLSGIWIYFQKTLDRVEQGDVETSNIYKKHYMIILDDGSMLWQSILAYAQKEAEQEVYLEPMTLGENEDYSQADCLRISIASQVDGIILRPDGTEEVSGLINEAAEQGIPVVAVLEDDPESKRISFVGSNSYQMADAYAQQAQRFLKNDKTEIMVLMDSQSQDSGSNLIYSQIVRALEEIKQEGQSITVTPYNIQDSGKFSAEEAIRDVFLNQDTLPDILICMDEVNTECAYQALVDYNLVGQINIIGFYYSDLILNAVQKGTIPATIAVNPEEIGRYSIDALEEYFTLGYASDYYSVGLNSITEENVSEYVDEESTKETEE